MHGPGIDARGATFAGIEPLRAARPRARLRLERHLGGPGHHRHLRAATLCEPGGATPTKASTHYRFRGPLRCRWRCSSARNAWTPSAGRPAPPPGSETLRAERTKLGHRDRARHRQGQAGGLHEAALHLLPRGRLGARLHALQRPHRDPQRRRTSSAPRPRSASPSTGSTPTTRTSPTSTRATTRCARQGHQPALPGERQASPGGA